MTRFEESNWEPEVRGNAQQIFPADVMIAGNAHPVAAAGGQQQDIRYMVATAGPPAGLVPPPAAAASREPRKRYLLVEPLGLWVKHGRLSSTGGSGGVSSNGGNSSSGISPEATASLESFPVAPAAPTANNLSLYSSPRNPPTGGHCITTPTGGSKQRPEQQYEEGRHRVPYSTAQQYSNAMITAIPLTEASAFPPPTNAASWLSGRSSRTPTPVPLADDSAVSCSQQLLPSPFEQAAPLMKISLPLRTITTCIFTPPSAAAGNNKEKRSSCATAANFFTLKSGSGDDGPHSGCCDVTRKPSLASAAIAAGGGSWHGGNDSSNELERFGYYCTTANGCWDDSLYTTIQDSAGSTAAVTYHGARNRADSQVPYGSPDFSVTDWSASGGGDFLLTRGSQQPHAATGGRRQQQRHHLHETNPESDTRASTQGARQPPPPQQQQQQLQPQAPAVLSLPLLPVPQLEALHMDKDLDAQSEGLCRKAGRHQRRLTGSSSGQTRDTRARPSHHALVTTGYSAPAAAAAIENGSQRLLLPPAGVPIATLLEPVPQQLIQLQSVRQAVSAIPATQQPNKQQQQQQQQPTQRAAVQQETPALVLPMPQAMLQQPIHEIQSPEVQPIDPIANAGPLSPLPLPPVNGGSFDSNGSAYDGQLQEHQQEHQDTMAPHLSAPTKDLWRSWALQSWDNDDDGIDSVGSGCINQNAHDDIVAAVRGNCDGDEDGRRLGDRVSFLRILAGSGSQDGWLVFAFNSTS
ncbi:hypothetical protein Vretimale_784 [Volvox reticuliferus]|uniref:Uncharacterized protein n=2 Tax=Volvox reticuliferus TaxID=1737510 RepID=A0A8J4D404_9CHLO|nr:hypothetical protein Vretimale_784 [Volvox reticuliferus]